MAMPAPDWTASRRQRRVLRPLREALTDGLYVRVLVDTLLIAAYVSVACLLLGYPVAYFLSVAPGPWPTVGIVFVLLPFWTSILVRTYGWSILGSTVRRLLGTAECDVAIAPAGLSATMPVARRPEREPLDDLRLAGPHG